MAMSEARLAGPRLAGVLQITAAGRHTGYGVLTGAPGPYELFGHSKISDIYVKSPNF